MNMHHSRPHTEFQAALCSIFRSVACPPQYLLLNILVQNMINHLEELFSYANVIPVINQVEFSPYNYQKDLLDVCNKNKIILEAYSPLTNGKINGYETCPRIKHNKTTAQVLIRWAIEHDLVVIPKSARKKRIVENADIFDFSLDKSDMKILDHDEGFRCSWDPTKID